MSAGKISVEDWVAISNLIGEYYWRVDENDAEGWADLFTPDGAFIGLGQDFRGREGLKQVPALYAPMGGRLRHSPAAIWIEYGATRDEALAKYHTLVTTWMPEPGPELMEMALCDLTLTRVDGSWKIRANNVTLLRSQGLEQPAALAELAL
jgi:uncharacterized protein (TIGR02246 family)